MLLNLRKLEDSNALVQFKLAIPAQAGIQKCLYVWIPACAGKSLDARMARA